MNVRLTVPVGEWRDLTDDELIELFDMMENLSQILNKKTQKSVSANKGNTKQASPSKPKVKTETRHVKSLHNQVEKEKR